MTTSVINWFIGTSNSVDTRNSGEAPEETPGVEVSVVSPTTTTENDEDDDTPPMFPAPSSAQRAFKDTSSSSNSNNSLQFPPKSAESRLMPPPSLPSSTLSVSGSSTRISLTPSISVSSASSTLKLPPSTIKPPKPKRREKVALAPGYGPLNWAALKSSGKNLRGVDSLGRIPPSTLKIHNIREDAWTAINGKVYNITPYLPFHPGGEKELMRVAGRDGSKLFALTHSWVNVDFMLDECVVGFLVPEPSA